MKNQELRAKIIVYNKAMAEKSEKAADMDTIVVELAKLPIGQLNKLLTEDVLAVLRKYGIEM